MLIATADVSGSSKYRGHEERDQDHHSPFAQSGTGFVIGGTLFDPGKRFKGAALWSVRFGCVVSLLILFGEPEDGWRTRTNSVCDGDPRHTSAVSLLHRSLAITTDDIPADVKVSAVTTSPHWAIDQPGSLHAPLQSR